MSLCTPQKRPNGLANSFQFPGLCAKRGLLCREEAIISVFENNTNAVVNIFDVTLQVQGHSQALQYCKVVLGVALPTKSGIVCDCSHLRVALLSVSVLARHNDSLGACCGMATWRIPF